MKRLLSLSLILSLASFSLSAAEEKKIDPKNAEVMAKMKEFSTPAEGHKVLAAMAGKWTFESRWWESATSKPHESKGSANFKMILGGRYLQQDHKGKAMGMSYEGMGLTGYDTLKKEYNTLWIDNMGTGFVLGKGNFDESSKTLTDKGAFTCPMEKDHSAEYRGEWKMVDKKNMTYLMYGKGMEGKEEFKMMEIVYKRK